MIVCGLRGIAERQEALNGSEPAPALGFESPNTEPELLPLAALALFGAGGADGGVLESCGLGALWAAGWAAALELEDLSLSGSESRRQ